MVNWLTREVEPASHLYSNYRRLSFEVEPGDVVLVEGRSRVSQVIKTVTQSNWTHSAIYIGRLVDIPDVELRETIASRYEGDPTEQLMIESLLGEGTIVAPLENYRGEHIRICRPIGLSSEDQLRVIRYAASQLGVPYDVRQLLDLARFLLPYGLFPRRWRSTLFEKRPGDATRHVCSSMMAEAYSAVSFPVLPFIERRPDGKVVLYKRNPRLFTPKDFDYSPYFDVLKFPYLDRGDIEAYRSLPWSESGVVYNDEDDFRSKIATASDTHVAEAEEGLADEDAPDAADESDSVDGEAEYRPSGDASEEDVSSEQDEPAEMAPVEADRVAGEGKD
jgi:hypothetical protein